MQNVAEADAAWSSDPPMADATSPEMPAGDASGDPNDLSAYSWLQSIEKTEPVDAEVEPQLADDGAAGDIPAGDIPAGDATETPATDSVDAAPSAEPVPAPAESDATAPSAAQERANQLLDELRALLPALAGSGNAVSESSTDVAESLMALLAERGAETEKFQSLRAAVATAQARPRDIDIMLDLVARADTIAAVLIAHDRYVAGIEDAVARLRGESKEEPTPRW
jgi:hypothetical protein